MGRESQNILIQKIRMFPFIAYIFTIHWAIGLINVVASVTEDVREIVTEYVGKYEFYHLFETPNLHWLSNRLDGNGYKNGAHRKMGLSGNRQPPCVPLCVYGGYSNFFWLLSYKQKFVILVLISQKLQNHIRKDGRNTHFLVYQCGIAYFSV